MIIIGDAHGKFKALQQIVDKHSDEDLIIQVGDLGLGFSDAKSDPADFGNNFKFIRGNHDNPAVCRQHKNYLGDYGVFDYNNKKVFFMGGAFSIDWHLRRDGLDWWYDEQLGMHELQDAIDVFETVKPDIVITHDCPKIMYNELIYGPFANNDTCNALQVMFNMHKPDIWIFGHHHKSISFNIDKTNFICVRELEVFKV